jgi:hypothetical protein
MPNSSARKAWRASPPPMATGPARVQSQHKDPRGFDDYIRQLSDHSVTGSANTLSWTAKVAFASPPAHFAHMIDVYDWADPERVERCGVP